MKPSTLDDTLTERVKKAAELMEIHIADHVILSPENEYYSKQTINPYIFNPTNNLSLSTNTLSLPFLSIMMGNNVSLTWLMVYIYRVSEIAQCTHF